MVGMCLTRARSPHIADELSWHLPFCGYATSRKNPLGLFICQIPEPFLTLPQKKPNLSVCSGDLPLLALPWWPKHAPANPVWLGTQILPFQSSHPAPPSSTATRGVPNNSEQLWSLLHGLWLLPFIGNFIVVAQCFGHWMWQFDDSTRPKFHNLVSRNPSHSLPSAAKSFICVSDYSHTFHQLFLLSCSQPMSDVTLLPLMICDTSKSCLNLAADKWVLNPKNRNTQTSSLEHEAFLTILTDRELKITKQHWKHTSFPRWHQWCVSVYTMTVCTTRYMSNNCPDHKQSHLKSSQYVQRLQNSFYTFTSAQKLGSIKFTKEEK